VRRAAGLGLVVALIVAAPVPAARAAGGGSAAPAGVAPLTGLADPHGIARHRPALVVKIENTPEARPQAGLDVADLVDEEVVEGGITRFWAVFNSRDPGVVGPIRSVRPLDPDLVAPLGGVTVYSGGTTPNVAAIRALGTAWVDQTDAGPAFYRDPRRLAPHNLYARTATLWGRAPPVPPPPQFIYASPDAPAPAGEPVHAVTLGFAAPYDVTYTYDSASRTWIRSYGSVPQRAASGRVIAPTNVIVEFVTYTGPADAQLLGTAADQEAWVLTDGRLVEGRWSKPTPTTPTRFTDRAGAPIALRPGSTWVELLPVGAPVGVTAAASPDRGSGH
jgi:hypothetical protein